MTYLRRLLILVVLVIPVMALAAACDILQLGNEAQPTPTPTATVSATAAAPTVPQIDQPVTVTQPVSQLRVWIPPEIGARTQASAEVLANQIQAFNTRYPELEIVVERKSIDGPGGIISYLRTGQPVAPGILPDLIALPAEDLAEPAVQELVYPLDPFIDEASLVDFYPASTAYAQMDSGILGYPFAITDLSHLVYASDLVTETVPLRWSQFISGTENTLLLPADSREGALFGLQYYLAEGGSLVNEAGQPDLELDPLVSALENIAAGKPNLLQSHQLKSLEEAWQLYQLGASNHVWTRSDYLLGERALLEGDTPIGQAGRGFAAVPGPNGPLVPLTNAWLWSVTTPEAPRQAVATELLLYLTESENLEAWTAVSRVLPPRRDVVATFSESDPYFSFVGQELERAETFPVAATDAMMDALGSAVFEVLATDDSPQAIAERTIAAFRQ
ncbi:MAG: extracellular solute-binding protein [Chloroflexota bacterium]